MMELQRMSEELQVAAMVPKQEEKDPHLSSKGQDQVITMDHDIFPSRISGRGYKIGPVSVSVRLLGLSQLNRVTYGPEIWYRDYL